MCIVQGETKTIANTKILVGTSAYDDSHQFVAYSNYVDIVKDPVAMILPFPNYYGTNFVKVIESTQYHNNMFDKLEDIFKQQSLSNAFFNTSSMNYHTCDTLPVYRSGNYRYSVVNSIDDFKYVDDIFKLTDKNIIDIFSAYYTKFGFIVCIIDKSAQYTPFMYISEKMPNNRFFIPTRHYHGHISEKESWDHKIFIIGTDEELSKTGAQILHPITHNFYLHPLSHMLASRKDECKALYIKGKHANGDIIVTSVH